LQELIYYVDSNDQPTGETAPKLEAHTLHTRLHAAFSCYVFNDNGELLVSQRALDKKVWPGVWTNTVCGHPAPGESREDAIVRRAQYELRLEIKDLKLMLPTYRYKTPPFNGIIENEYCPVYFARLKEFKNPNPAEVEDFTWMPWDVFKKEIFEDQTDKWSWWCKDQVKQLENLPDIKQYIR
jgi:isopentenyl-diphosphate Delta-isomerase